MNIKDARVTMQELIKHSEELRNGFHAMVTSAPQVLDGEDLRELRDAAVIIAAHFATCANSLHHFAQIKGDKYIPSMRMEVPVKSN